MPFVLETTNGYRHRTLQPVGADVRNPPGAAREFNTTFGLNQPGAKVALKVFVITNTGNEAGSAVMFVQRPFSAVA